ncbi:Hypothetical protein CAP_5489 [Chondromyces apiculatus DSM 436]|uniref:Glycosyltransferase n=1 Tax=Chondromyces apiculatus DSM 436 TaxID=1192034 RepID=A0A017T3V6_9BACT|nr:Hypothetical protein CAP_5489 [Chondromyces apiculatus DSM 436]
MTSMPDASPRSFTFLLTSSSATGHFLRVLDIAQQLSSRGHRVLFLARSSAADEVKRAGAEHIPYTEYLDMHDRIAALRRVEPPSWFPKVPLGIAVASGMLRGNGAPLAREVEPILRREKVDCVVHDFFEYGAGWAAERAGIPFASAGNMGTSLTRDELPLLFGLVPPFKHVARIPALAHALMDKFLPVRADREALGLPPYRERVSAMAQAMVSPCSTSSPPTAASPARCPCATARSSSARPPSTSPPPRTRTRRTSPLAPSSSAPPPPAGMAACSGACSKPWPPSTSPSSPPPRAPRTSRRASAPPSASSSTSPTTWCSPRPGR